MYAETIRHQAENAPRAALPAVAAALWQAFSAGQVTEPEAETLSRLIEERQRAGQDHRTFARTPDAAVLADAGVVKRWGSRPRTPQSMERRRRWAASGHLPPQLASHFTLAEQAVLALVAAETVRRKDCRLAVPHIAAIAGVAETTVRNAIREARKLGLLTVEERKVTGFRNLPNIVRIVSPEWTAWLRLGRRDTRTLVQGRVQIPEGHAYSGSRIGENQPRGPQEKLPEGSGRPRPARSNGARRGW